MAFGRGEQGEPLRGRHVQAILTDWAEHFDETRLPDGFRGVAGSPFLKSGTNPFYVAFPPIVALLLLPVLSRSQGLHVVGTQFQGAGK